MAEVISKWRTPEDARHTSGLIGPNAILQLLPVLDRHIGANRREQMLKRAGILKVPDGLHMIPETQAAQLHRQLRYEEHEKAQMIAAEAGVATGEYILEHRIPRAAQSVLRALPRGIAARFLSRAIAQHAWTFVGSGKLHVLTPWTYEIENNPVISGEGSAGCLCSWHEGVFSRLYQSLVAPDVDCIEVCCGAQGQDRNCRFEVRPKTCSSTA